MRKESSNQFTEGLVCDLNPINTPNTALTDALKDDVELYCYMSKVNPGMSKIAEFKQGDEGEVEKVAEYAKENGIEICL